jgi:chemotaxis-related protein WspD
VAELRPARRVPHRDNPALIGLVNIRGELQLCVDPGILLGLNPDEIPVRRRLLVVDRGERWVFRVDEVFGIVRIPESKLGIPPSTVSGNLGSFSRHVFVWQNRRVGLIDTERLIDTLRGAFA